MQLLCRGNIEDSGSVSDSKFSGKIAKAAILISVTQKMAPKCRLLAFFVRTDGEFVGDSEEIPIEKKFENEVCKGIAHLLVCLAQYVSCELFSNAKSVMRCQ